MLCQPQRSIPHVANTGVRLDYSAQGFTKPTPVSAKSATLRVTRVRLCTRAVAAISPSGTGSVRRAIKWPQAIATSSSIDKMR